MNIVLGVIALFALLSLVVVVMQAVAMVRLAPAKARLASFMPLGWWKFRKIGAMAGPAAAEPLNIYKRAVIAFLFFIALGLLASGWMLTQIPAAGSTAAASGLINDPRVIPAQYSINSEFRRVASPGAPILES